MKQLLHSSRSFIVIGFQNRVYLLSRKKDVPTTTLVQELEVNDKNIVSVVEAIAVNEQYCAVSRSDKSLTIYLIYGSNSPKIIATYKTSKRVIRLVICTIGSTLQVLVSGNVAGDAEAFSLEPKESTATRNGNEEEEEEMNEASCYRLLLGHTASMLTAVCVGKIPHSEKQHQMVLLTADRDEKIRVSNFPDTHVIHGFLLGHTSFVSDLAVVPSDLHYCVSCGGDGTIKVWNYHSCQEIASCSFPQDHDNNHNVKDSTSSLIPSRIAVTRLKRTTKTFGVACVIYDNVNYLDVFTIFIQDENDDEKLKNISIQHTLRRMCPVQPLALEFLDSNIDDADDNNILAVAMKDPEYIKAYQVVQDKTDETIISLDEVTIPCLNAVVATAQEQEIAVIDSIVEKSKSGHLKVEKLQDTRSNLEPEWNNKARIPVAKEKIKRHRKRKAIERNSQEETGME